MRLPLLTAPTLLQFRLSFRLPHRLRLLIPANTSHSGVWLALAISACVLACGSEARASIKLVTSRSLLNGSDFIDWGQFTHEYQLINNPTHAVSNRGDVVMVSQLLPYPFMRLTELYGAGQGNFAPWDPVLYTNNYDWRRNPIMLTEFDGLGIVAGGLQIRSNYYGRFVARVEAFDDGGNSLGFFDANGVSNTAGDNSGLFIGVTGDSPIVSLAFSIISDNMLPVSYSVNRFEFTPVPGPGPMPLLGVAAGFGFSRSLRRRIKDRQAARRPGCPGP
jgi:hypothetical protein